MKSALGNGWKWLLGSLLTLLGFTGCAKIGIFRNEYGCPNADFKLVGEVKDAKGKGIEGIRVVFKPYPLEQDEGNRYRYDTLYTDAQGHFVKERLGRRCLIQTRLLFRLLLLRMLCMMVICPEPSSLHPG